MTEDKNLMQLPTIAVVTLAQEIWRLWRMIERHQEQSNALSLRYSVKKMKQTLEMQGISLVDLTSKTYDAGMAVDIVDTEGEKTDEQMTLTIKEIIAPIVLHNEKLLSHGQAILQWKKNSTGPIQDGGQ
jgi:hypothetical protein